MKRTPLKERILPSYTLGEETANMITHIIGGAIGVAITVFAIIISAMHNNTWGVVSSSIYGFTFIAVFTISSVYHGLRTDTSKKVMQIIDHCAIYFLIAGTYTPILLSAIRPNFPVVAWVIFGVQWGLCALAVTFNAIDLKKYSVFSLICNIVMGWCIIVAIKQTIFSITLNGFTWLLLGGIAYTLGAVLYVIGAKKKYFHTVFHIFVNIGGLLQGISILRYVL